jgi:coatomer protein complex subunit gamma
VILENSAVRAAAIAALGKFAARCPSLRSSIATLLNRSLGDEDDETRDRTAIVLTIVERAMEEHPYIPPPEDAQADEIPPDEPVVGDIAAFLLLDGLPMSFDKLQRSLMRYKASPGAMDNNVPLTFASLPIVEDYPEESKVSDISSHDVPSLTNAVQSNVVAKDRLDPASAVYAIPEFSFLGQAFRSSIPVALTESETEYVVTCIKHMFPNHVVLQFNVQNTVEDQRLENVAIALESSSDCFEIAGEIEANKIKYGETKSCFTLLTRDHSKDWQNTPFTCTLRFNVIQVDPASGEDESDPFDEEYALENLSVTTGDYMAKITVPDFRRSWEMLGGTYEVTEKFALQQKSLEDALTSVILSLGMQPCDGTGTIKAGGKPHMLHASGVFIGGKNVLVRAQIASNQDSVGMVLKIAVRSDDPTISRMVAECVL